MKELNIQIIVAIAGLGEKIKQKRKQRGLSVEELAAASGMTRQYLYLIEKGDTQSAISCEKIINLEKALDTKLLLKKDLLASLSA